MGVYVWEMPNGQWIGDDEGNFLSIAAAEGSRIAIEAISREVRNYIDPVVGKPLFIAGRRKITDEEFEHQKARAAAGLVPDPYDFAAIAEEEAYVRRRK